MHVTCLWLGSDMWAFACYCDAGTLPTLLAQRMVAYPTLVEDAEDDDDTTAFRRRVKDTIPVLAPSPAAAESKVPCAPRIYAAQCLWQLCVVLFVVLCACVKTPHRFAVSFVAPCVLSPDVELVWRGVSSARSGSGH